MTDLADQILALRAEGFSYDQICSRLQCSKSTVSYHLGEGQKDKTLARQRKNRSADALIQKTHRFQETQRNKPLPRRKQDKDCLLDPALRLDKKSIEFQTIYPDRTYEKKFTPQDVREKIGEHPICYLTGRSINLDEPSTYHFDHIVPRCRGGSVDLDNLGVAVSDANRAKGGLSVEEFLNLCLDVVQYHGYEIKT